MKSRPQPSMTALLESLATTASESPNQPPHTKDKAGSPYGRHSRKCAICNHADRALIDADFVNWRSGPAIMLDYQLPSRSCIFRHAAATGLLERRRCNLRGVCERIIERVDEATPSAFAVLRALRIYSQITEDGHWVEPPKRSIITHVHTDHSGTAAEGDPGREAPLTGGPSAAPSAQGGVVGDAALQVEAVAANSSSPDSSSKTVGESLPGSDFPQPSKHAPIYFAGGTPGKLYELRDLQPHWQREFLIGTENDSPEELNTRK